MLLIVCYFVLICDYKLVVVNIVQIYQDRIIILFINHGSTLAFSCSYPDLTSSQVLGIYVDNGTHHHY